MAYRWFVSKKLLAEDWIREIPGINAAGSYKDFAKDPWKTVSMIFKKVESGNYEHFCPATKRGRKAIANRQKEGNRQ